MIYVLSHSITSLLCCIFCFLSVSPGIFHIPRCILLFSLSEVPPIPPAYLLAVQHFITPITTKHFHHSVQISHSTHHRPKSNRAKEAPNPWAKRNPLFDPFSIGYSDIQNTDYHNALGKLRFNEVVRVGPHKGVSGLLRSERDRPQQGTTRTQSSLGYKECSHWNHVLCHLALKHLQRWELHVNHEEVSV